ncbi:unnamed protein product [Arctogadus glacialis]
MPIRLPSISLTYMAGREEKNDQGSSELKHGRGRESVPHHCDEVHHHGVCLQGQRSIGASLSPSYIKGDDMKALEEQRSGLNGLKVRSQL